MPRNQTYHLITGQRYGFFTYGINRKNGININPTIFFLFSHSSYTYSLQRSHPPAPLYRNPHSGGFC